MKQKTSYEPVAIIGYGCTYAGPARNKEKFWDMIVNGKTGVQNISGERVKWEKYYSTDKTAEDKTYSCLQGLCDYPGMIGKDYNGKVDTHGLNRTQIMSLRTIIEAFENTKYKILELKGKRIGYYMGNMLGDDCYYEFSLQYHRDEIKKYMELCMVTGALGCVNVTGSIGFAKIGGLSDELSRPMDQNAKGLNASEGFGSILIKPLSKAIKNQDHIYGVITGTGVSNDGHGKSIYAPNRKGQVKCMRAALKKGEVLPDQLDYIELHATGTQTGDYEEYESLKMLFQDSKVENQSIPIGSVKSQIGHSFSAAGMAGIIKVLECFHHRTLPPTWGFTKVKEDWHIEDTPFYVNKENTKWRAKDSHYRTMINAFGFGGSNASVVLEEYIPEGQYGKTQTDIEAKDTTECDIAITGLAVMEPERMEGFSDNRWSPMFVEAFGLENKKVGLIEPLNFPFLKYKIPPIVLKQIDRTQQIALITAGKAIEDYGAERMKGQHVSVYVGKNMHTEQASAFNTGVRYIEFFDDLDELPEIENLGQDIKDKMNQHIKKMLRSYIPAMTEDGLPGYMDNIVASRISNFYDFDSASVVIDGWTNSFSIALSQAIAGLQNGSADLSVVGGIGN